jgi:phenylacetate-CoA ligase
MRLIRGTNVYPRAVEAIIREYEAIDEFQIHLYTADGIRDEIEILVEIPDPGSDTGSLLSDLGKALAEAHEGLRFHVKQAPDGSLPRFELKARRLLDEREVVGGSGERKQA